MSKTFKAGDKVKILSLNSKTARYGSGTEKYNTIGSIVTVDYIGNPTGAAPFACVDNKWHFDFDDIELVGHTLIISKDRSYKNSNTFGVKLKYIGRAFMSESGTVSISDEDGNVSGAIYKSLENDVTYKIIEIPAYIFPEMYNITDSSTVSSIGHDMEDKLCVSFHSGGTYEYKNVTIQEFHKMLVAKSKGTFFRDNIRGIKEFKKVI